MKNLKLHRLRMNRTLINSMTLLAVIITAALVHGHGGKHSDKFTQLQALQKATILYDQLIEKGKLVTLHWATLFRSLSYQTNPGPKAHAPLRQGAADPEDGQGDRRRQRRK